MKNRRREEVINTAFKKAKQSKKRGKETIEEAKITAIKHYLLSFLKKRIKKLDVKLSDFEKSIIESEIDYEKIKKEAGGMQKSIEIIEKLFKEFKKRMKQTKDKKTRVKLMKSFYGRVSSVIKRLSFEETEKFFISVKRLPKIKKMPTLIIMGFPNVGKSEIMKRMCNTRVKTAPYPFTTKKLLVGFMNEGRKEVQVIDTPGILDRPFEKMKSSEKKAIIALKKITNKILFVIDPSETCGYSLEEQEKLLKRIKSSLNADIITVATKKDIPHEKKPRTNLNINALDKKDIELTKRRVIQHFFK